VVWEGNRSAGMADNPRKRGKRDRSRVSNQKHELHYMAKKLGTTWQAICGAERVVGNNRQKIETYIKGQRLVRSQSA